MSVDAPADDTYMRHQSCSRLLAGLLTALAVCAAAPPAAAQSLGEVARLEEARRKAIKGPVKVYTNESLVQIPGETIPTPPGPAPASNVPETPATAGGSPIPGAQAGDQPPVAAAPDPRKSEEYWRKRIGDARLQHDRNEQHLAALQSQINGLWADFTARDDPAQRAVIGNMRQRALDELERLKKEQQDLEKQIAAIEEEARRAGVPAGWLR